MATKTFYLLGTVENGNGFFQQLQDGGSAPAAANTSGWKVGKTATSTPYLAFKAGATASSASSASPTIASVTSGTSTTAGGNALRTPAAMTGNFDSGTWSFTIGVIATTVSSQQGHVNVRVYKSANADGSGATELTTAPLAPASNTALSTTAQNQTFSWSPGALTLNNEYLFFAIEWQITTAGGSVNANVLLRTGSTIVTPNFAAIYAASASESASTTDRSSSAGTLLAAQAEAAVSADSAAATGGDAPATPVKWSKAGTTAAPDAYGGIRLINDAGGYTVISDRASQALSGKVYYELQIGPAMGDGTWGFTDPALDPGSNWPGEASNTFGWLAFGGLYNDSFGSSGANVEAFGASDILCVAVDVPNRLFWGKKNGGNWNNDAAADPAAGVGGGTINGAYDLIPTWSWMNSQALTDWVELHAKAANFTYAAPTGFSAYEAAASAGGTTFNDTANESANAIDSGAAGLAASAAKTEIAAAVDAVAGSAALAATRAETATTADARGSSLALSGSAAETAATSDGQAAVAMASLGASEAVAAADATNSAQILAGTTGEAWAGTETAIGQTVAVATRSEILSAGESAAFTGTSMREAAETAAASETAASASIANAMRAESVDAAEAQSALLLAVAALAEAGLALDQSAAALAAVAARTESVAAIETSTPGAAQTAVATDAVTVGDAQTVLLTLGGLLTEALAATDAAVTVQVAGLSVSESGVVLDLVLAGLALSAARGETAATKDAPAVNGASSAYAAEALVMAETAVFGLFSGASIAETAALTDGAVSVKIHLDLPSNPDPIPLAGRAMRLTLTGGASAPGLNGASGDKVALRGQSNDPQLR